MSPTDGNPTPKSSKAETLCQYTGLPFAGRGKNHPDLRPVLQDAFELDVYDPVTQALMAARGADTDIAQFRKVATDALAQAVNTVHGFAAIDDAAREAIYEASRRKTPRGDLLLQRGLRWRRVETEPGTYSWELRDPRGQPVASTTAALAVIAIDDAEAVQMVERGLFVTPETREQFRTMRWAELGARAAQLSDARQ